MKYIHVGWIWKEWMIFPKLDSTAATTIAKIYVKFLYLVAIVINYSIVYVPNIS